MNKETSKQNNIQKPSFLLHCTRTKDFVRIFYQGVNSLSPSIRSYSLSVTSLGEKEHRPICSPFWGWFDHRLFVLKRHPRCFVKSMSWTLATIPFGDGLKYHAAVRSKKSHTRKKNPNFFIVCLIDCLLLCLFPIVKSFQKGDRIWWKKSQVLNVKCQMSSVKCQISNPLSFFTIAQFTNISPLQLTMNFLLIL